MRRSEPLTGWTANAGRHL